MVRDEAMRKTVKQTVSRNKVATLNAVNCGGGAPRCTPFEKNPPLP